MRPIECPSNPFALELGDISIECPPKRRALTLLLPLIAATLITACAAPTHYAGIDLRPTSGVSAEVQALAGRARTGDKQAQLDLGIAYEEGNGLPQDAKQARRLYRVAAATSGGTIYVYVPAAQMGGRGYVTPVNTGPVVTGLEAARVRLGVVKVRAIAVEGVQ